MAPLPAVRVKHASTLQVTSVGQDGPLYLKDKRRVWIVLFTYAGYRCVHLELATALTNFQGANNLFKELDWKTIERETRIQRIL